MGRHDALDKARDVDAAFTREDQRGLSFENALAGLRRSCAVPIPRI
jgi:hypothetical protein